MELVEEELKLSIEKAMAEVNWVLSLVTNSLFNRLPDDNIPSLSWLQWLIMFLLHQKHKVWFCYFFAVKFEKLYPMRINKEFGRQKSKL